MHVLLMKVAGMRLKVSFQPKCLYRGPWKMNWYSQPYTSDARWTDSVISFSVLQHCLDDILHILHYPLSVLFT